MNSYGSFSKLMIIFTIRLETFGGTKYGKSGRFIRLTPFRVISEKATNTGQIWTTVTVN